MLQPSAEKAAAYSRHLYDIAMPPMPSWPGQAESQFGDAEEVHERRRQRREERARRHRERAVSLVKSAITAANNAYEACTRLPNRLPTSPRPTSMR